MQEPTGARGLGGPCSAAAVHQLQEAADIGVAGNPAAAGDLVGLIRLLAAARLNQWYRNRGRGRDLSRRVSSFDPCNEFLTWRMALLRIHRAFRQGVSQRLERIVFDESRTVLVHLGQVRHRNHVARQPSGFEFDHDLAFPIDHERISQTLRQRVGIPVEPFRQALVRRCGNMCSQRGEKILSPPEQVLTRHAVARSLELIELRVRGSRLRLDVLIEALLNFPH